MRLTNSLPQVSLKPWLLLALVLATGCQRPADQPFHPASPDQCQSTLESLWSTALRNTPDDRQPRMKREWKITLTTWLPDQWPPGHNTRWTRYAYGLDVSLDGSSDVSAPFARIECIGGDASRQMVVPMDDRLKVIAVHPVRPHDGWRYTADDEKRMLATAMALRTSLPAGSRTGIGVKSYFESWRLGNAEIARHVSPRHSAFFSWLAGRD